MAQKEPRSRSFFKQQRVLLLLLLPITALFLAISIYAVSTMQREIHSYVAALAQTQIDQLFSSFNRANTSLRRTLVENELLIVKAQSNDTVARIAAQSALIKKCAYPISELGTEYTFFFYFEATETYFPAHNSTAIPIAARGGVEQAVVEHIHQLQTPQSSISPQWQIVFANNSYFAVKLYHHQGAWMGALVPAEALIAPYQNAIAQKESFPVLVTQNGVLLTGHDRLLAEGIDEANLHNLRGTFFTPKLTRWLATDSAESDTGFYIKYFTKGFGQFERLMLVQGITVGLIVLILTAMCLTVLYLRRKVLRPLRQFTDGLRRLNPDAPFLQLSANDILELEDANEQFRNLLTEIKKLKISAYEQRLSMQKVQMDYMQLQIKPHFFLNCLNLIHTMAQNKQYTEISRLSESTTKYLRYIFQSDAPFMALEQEVEHLRSFLAIMEIRYPKLFSYDIYVDSAVQEARVPPLLLQTFVENSIKHARLPHKHLELSISILHEERGTPAAPQPYLEIFMTDNGRGYPQPLLALWNQQHDMPPVDGHHIGIANVRKRLHYAYEGKAECRLYNSPLQGAVVELHLPLHPPTERKKPYEPAFGG